MKEPDLSILRRYASGAELKTIAAELKLDQEVVNEVVAAVGFQRSRASQLLREHEHALAKARNTSAVPAKPATKPAGGEAIAVDAILAAADKAGGKFVQRADRLRTLAVDLDRGLADLERDLKTYAEVMAAEREVERLRIQLAAANEKLRAAKTPTAPPAPPPGPIVDFKAVRRWAAENGVECSAAGRVPRHVIKAYREATGAAA